MAKGNIVCPHCQGTKTKHKSKDRDGYIWMSCGDCEKDFGYMPGTLITY